MSKPLVYIASAYLRGDAAINTRFQMEMFDQLLGDGVVLPFAPLLSHFQHLVFPRPQQEWVDYDLALLPKMDALLRLTVLYPMLSYRQEESIGADGEVAEMLRLGKPVFYGVPALYEWAEGWK